MGEAKLPGNGVLVYFHSTDIGAIGAASAALTWAAAAAGASPAARVAGSPATNNTREQTASRAEDASVCGARRLPRVQPAVCKQLRDIIREPPHSVEKQIVSTVRPWRPNRVLPSIGRKRY